MFPWLLLLYNDYQLKRAIEDLAAVVDEQDYRLWKLEMEQKGCIVRGTKAYLPPPIEPSAPDAIPPLPNRTWNGQVPEGLEGFHARLMDRARDDSQSPVNSTPPSKPHKINVGKLRVECRACGAHIAGKKARIQLLRTCPKCGAKPFDYRLLPNKERA